MAQGQWGSRTLGMPLFPLCIWGATCLGLEGFSNLSTHQSAEPEVYLTPLR